MQTYLYQKSHEFDQHAQCYRFHDPSKHINGFIAIHRESDTMPSFGATRLVHYVNESDAMHAALRISKAMTLKSKVLGLPYGGAKGVFLVKKSATKQAWIHAYAEIINALKGKFITGADAGLTQQDIVTLKKHTPYVTGCYVEPAYHTAQGILLILHDIAEAGYVGALTKKLSYAIKGVGKVGQYIVDAIYKHASKVYIADQSQDVVEKLLQKYPDLIVLTPETIHQAEVDIFCPCAYNHAITRSVVSELNCKVIIGSENNQLKDESLSHELHKKEILYVPDFIANCGGYLSVVSEYEDTHSSKQYINTTLEKLSKTVIQFIEESIQINQPLLTCCREWYEGSNESKH